MRPDLKKAAVATILGVLTLAPLAAATPAAAGGWHGRGGWGYGHGGGWGYRHGGWGRYGGWGPGWGYRRHYGGGWGVPLAAGLLGGLAVGAVASRPYYGYGYGYYAPACYPADQPVVDGWGNIVAYRRVQVCN